LSITITTAPCCWGVDDVKNPNLPPWQRVLDEAAAAGYGGLELGPYGYVPLDRAVMSAALGQRVASGAARRNSPLARSNDARATPPRCGR
jgi:sugar phosphate isomerase/epimerase